MITGLLLIAWSYQFNLLVVYFYIANLQLMLVQFYNAYHWTLGTQHHYKMLMKQIQCMRVEKNQITQ